MLEPAVSELKRSMETLLNNEPINRKEGNVRQANLERNNAQSFGKAIEVLSAIRQ